MSFYSKIRSARELAARGEILGMLRNLKEATDDEKIVDFLEIVLDVFMEDCGEYVSPIFDK